MIIVCIRDMLECVGMPILYFRRVLLEFLEIFQKPPGGSRVTRQATQAPDLGFWVFFMNRLAAEKVPPGDTKSR